MIGSIPIITLIMLAFIHWEADFSMQTHQMAMGKSKSNYWLTLHVLVYTGVTLLFWRFFIFDPSNVYCLMDYFKFSLFIFSTHWITDYITSRISGKLYKDEKYHEFFALIGIDQLIHLIQLVIAFNYFK
jgi:hypothetical protein